MTPEETTARQIALDQAVKVALNVGESSPSSVVDCAEDFYTFLTDK